MQTMLDGIPEAFGNRLRLAILAVLMEGNGESDFVSLREKTGASDGNLSTQLTRLEELGYLESKKELVQKKTRTSYRLTTAAVRAYRQFLTLLVGSMLKKQNDGDT